MGDKDCSTCGYMRKEEDEMTCTYPGDVCEYPHTKWKPITMQFYANELYDMVKKLTEHINSVCNAEDRPESDSGILYNEAMELISKINNKG